MSITLFRENYRIALASVRSRRMSSFLTLVGVIVGVVSVVTIASLGEGVKNQILHEAHRQGGDVVVIKPGKQVGSPLNSLSSAPTGSTVLTDKDVSATKNVEGISEVVPLAVISAAPSYQDHSYDGAVVIGTTGKMPELTGAKLEFGAFFDDESPNRKVAIIGPHVAENLFKEAIPIGKTIKIRDQDFVVRGVLEKAQPGPLSTDTNFNSAVIIPAQMGKILTGGNGNYYEIVAKVSDPDKVKKVAADITSAVQKEHGNLQDFSVIKSSDNVLFANNLVGTITALTGALAVISLLIGGVSIMNIMLVSVTERTREIGIRKAVGASNQQIRVQFLMEAAVLSLWGAFIGLGVAGLINIVLRVATNLQPVITWQPVVASVIVSVVVGIIFGTAPAVKAARKDPIEALRSGQ